MDAREREELLDALVERLGNEGIPQGSWLVEIAQARESIAQIDGLLRRLAVAIVASMSALPPFN